MSDIFGDRYEQFCVFFVRRATGSQVYIDLPEDLTLGPEMHPDGLKGWYKECWDYADTIVSEENWLAEKWEAVLTPSQRGRIKDV